MRFAGSMNSAPQGLDRPKTNDPVPEGLDWNLWLGPAPERPFNRAYLPFVWRGWYDFGCGAFGDMGCYSFDTIFRVLKLEAPMSVESREPIKEGKNWSVPHPDLLPKGEGIVIDHFS